MDVPTHDITLTSSPFPKARPILAASPALASTETPVMPAGAVRKTWDLIVGDKNTDTYLA
jgi:hypothetical protein